MDEVRLQLETAMWMRGQLDGLSFGAPVSCVYNPLDYAWGAFEEYVTRYGGGLGRTLFLGMNPGPWGMTQTGVPFGEVGIVTGWLGIDAQVGRPKTQHPNYPIEGYDCKRSEVSGRRLWGLFRKRFGDAAHFFQGHYVVNYCPLLFIASKTRKSGKEGASNLTPDKLPAAERAAVYEICDEGLRRTVAALSPRCVVGVGNFASGRAALALGGGKFDAFKILHPSPASPKSNADWAGEATRQLEAQGVWEA